MKRVSKCNNTTNENFIDNLVFSLKIYGTHRIQHHTIKKDEGSYMFNMDVTRYTIVISGNDTTIKNNDTLKECNIGYGQSCGHEKLAELILLVLPKLSIRTKNDNLGNERALKNGDKKKVELAGSTSGNGAS